MRSMTALILCGCLALALAGCKDNTGPEQLPAPVFTPVPVANGSFDPPLTVTISCAEPGAELRYTTDGSQPTQASLLYTAPLHLYYDTGLKARAYKDNSDPSPVASASYLLNPFLGELILIEGGSYDNGRGTVTLDSFYLDKFEMTQAGYAALMGHNPSFFSGVTNGPVDRVSWNHAIAYCNRRSLAESLTPCYNYGIFGSDPENWPPGWDNDPLNHKEISCAWNANGYRLPTSAEWEFAARGGNLAQGFIYSGSNNINQVAWYTGNAGQTTHSVSSLNPNGLGLFHLSGNLFEWCWDIHEPELPHGPQLNPHGPDEGESRTRRGGAWDSPPEYCMISHRFANAATYAGYEAGFRVCRSAP